MRFALCNEMFQGASLSQVCRTAGHLGYEGVEIAPFTLSQYAPDITAAQRRETRLTITDVGLEVVGLHWLFVGPEGLHLTAPDTAIRKKTQDYLSALVDLCHDLGGSVMVIGSPQQRSLIDGQTAEGAWRCARALFESVLERASQAGVVLCLEPLAPVETDFINTVSQALEMVDQIAHSNFKVHLDVKAMCAEDRPVEEIIRSTPLNAIGHVHVNDANLLSPGMGNVDFAPILSALKEIGWEGWLSLEVFEFSAGGETLAQNNITYLKSLLNSLRA